MIEDELDWILRLDAVLEVRGAPEGPEAANSCAACVVRTKIMGPPPEAPAPEARS